MEKENYEQTVDSSKDAEEKEAAGKESAEKAESFEIEVAYATPEKQKIISLMVKPGITALDAAEMSGIIIDFPEIDLSTAKLGLFGKAFGARGLKPANEYELQPRDRVEIYRPLIADPKEVRRRRAEKAKNKTEK